VKKDINKDINLVELEKKCIEMKDQLAKMKMQLQFGQLSNTAEVRKLRRSIARSKSEIHLRKREVNE
jgi:ribosomal protein L29